MLINEEKSDNVKKKTPRVKALEKCIWADSTNDMGLNRLNLIVKTKIKKKIRKNVAPTV